MSTKIAARTHARFQEFARDNGLPPEAADRMMAMLADHIAAMNAHRRTLVARWADRVRTDPEIGRQAFASTIHLARQAVERFGGEKLKQALDDTGAGSHPEIIRAFYRVGKAMPPPPANASTGRVPTRGVGALAGGWRRREP